MPQGTAGFASQQAHTWAAIQAGCAGSFNGVETSKLEGGGETAEDDGHLFDVVFDVPGNVKNDKPKSRMGRPKGAKDTKPRRAVERSVPKESSEFNGVCVYCARGDCVC